MPNQRQKSGRPRGRVPALYHYKSSGQGFVRIDGRDRCLGTDGFEECEAAYKRLVAEYLDRGEVSGDTPGTGPAAPTVNELPLAYWRFADADTTRIYAERDLGSGGIPRAIAPCWVS